MTKSGRAQAGGDNTQTSLKLWLEQATAGQPCMGAGSVKGLGANAQTLLGKHGAGRLETTQREELGAEEGKRQTGGGKQRRTDGKGNKSGEIMINGEVLPKG